MLLFNIEALEQVNKVAGNVVAGLIGEKGRTELKKKIEKCILV